MDARRKAVVGSLVKILLGVIANLTGGLHGASGSRVDLRSAAPGSASGRPFHRSARSRLSSRWRINDCWLDGQAWI